VVVTSGETPVLPAWSQSDMKTEKRWTLGALFLLSALAAVAAIVGFVGWVNQDNAITWPAMEDATTPVYPANHMLYGHTLAIAATGLVTLAIIGLWAWLSASGGRIVRSVRMWTIMWFALSVGLATTTSIRYSPFLAVPFIISAGIAIVRAHKTANNDLREWEESVR